MIELLNPIIKSKEQLTLPSVYFKPSQTWLKEAQLFLTTHQLKKGQYIVFGLGARREKKQASKEQIIETAIYATKNISSKQYWSGLLEAKIIRITQVTTK